MSSAEVAAPSAAGAWLRLARVSNTPTVVSEHAGRRRARATAAEAGTVALVAVAMALFYTAGMILNDVLDLEVDRARAARAAAPVRRGQPAGGDRRRRRAVRGRRGAAAGRGLEPASAGLGLIALIVLYDAWHKGNPLSPLLMGGCRALVYVVAALAVAGAVPLEVWTAAAVLLLYIVGLTQVAKAEGGGLPAAWPLAAVLGRDRLLGRLGRLGVVRAAARRLRRVGVALAVARARRRAGSARAWSA